MHQVYHTVYKGNTRVKEIWFRFADEIAFILYFTVKTNVYQNLIKLVFSLI